MGNSEGTAQLARQGIIKRNIPRLILMINRRMVGGGEIGKQVDKDYYLSTCLPKPQ